MIRKVIGLPRSQGVRHSVGAGQGIDKTVLRSGGMSMSMTGYRTKFRPRRHHGSRCVNSCSGWIVESRIGAGHSPGGVDGPGSTMVCEEIKRLVGWFY